MRLQRGGALTRLGNVRAGAELLNIGRECGGSAGTQSIGPSFLVFFFARLVLERGDALACLGNVGAGTELLYIAGECGERADA